jgi:hypothetical protein
MRRMKFAAALAFILCPLSCGAAQVGKPTPTPTPTTTKVYPFGTGEGVDPATSAALKELLFADLSLEELMAKSRPSESGQYEGPWRNFALALSDQKLGKTGEAKKELKQVLATPDPETRLLLSAWTALRALGERPAAEADKVQGVVVELHNEAGVGTLAAYADGRARWLGGQGAVIGWEAPGSDREVDSLIAELLKAAGPLVKRGPPVERHKSAEVAMNYVRVSVLTFGGIHVTELYGPDVDKEKGRFAAATLMAGLNLLNALWEK